MLSFNGDSRYSLNSLLETEDAKRIHSYNVRLERSVPKSPQHDGVAERRNRTIFERIRCMLSHSKLPKSFFGEAMRIAVDLINLSPSSLNGDVLERVWIGKYV